MRTILLTIASAFAIQAGNDNPIVRSWLVNPAAQSTTNPALRGILPDVQSVRTDENYVYVESAGLSLQSLSPLDANDREPTAGPRKLHFRFPLKPAPAEKDSIKTPLEVIGAFLNGVPIYNPTSPVSYHDQNLWHLDAVASLSQHARTNSPLLQSLLVTNNGHSPLIGYAFDGNPIYGPYAWDQDGKVQRVHSSYRLRPITRRTTLPDGTELTPSQEGPPVNAEFPLGTFAEDYEYVPGAGDLDEHNGRSTRTPEYPQGTYAYFLTTYPYLVGASYFGRVPSEPLPRAISHHAPLDQSQVRQIDLTTPATLDTRQPSLIALTIRDAQGRKIRFLEKVHELPIHLLIVSTDLAEFAHIHPEIQSDDTYTVSYSFPHGGTYWLYADYTRPGAPQSISRFRVSVKGAPRPAEALCPDTNFTKTQEGFEVRLTIPQQLRAGQDLTFRFDVPVNDLEPYLGAWAHIVIVSGDRQQFIHAHPQDAVGQHTHHAGGPSPSTIQTTTGFHKPGIYRLWAQFQRQGKVITIPFTFKVEPEEKKPQAITRIPPDAIRIEVSNAGFDPARITINAGKPIVLAFDRKDPQNCASSVAFPELGLSKPLPAGEITLVEIPVGPKELHFTCGMNMYRGALIIK